MEIRSDIPSLDVIDVLHFHPYSFGATLVQLIDALSFLLFHNHVFTLFFFLCLLHVHTCMHACIQGYWRGTIRMSRPAC